MEIVANPAANLQHNTLWTTRSALGRLAASMPMWKMRSAAKRSVKTAAAPAATRGPTSGAGPDSNKGAQLRPTPGSKPRTSETKDSRSAMCNGIQQVPASQRMRI